MAGPNWKLEDDYKTVTVTFPTSPETTVRPDVSGVEDILKNLGTFRQLMKPEIERDFAMGQTVQAIDDPRWVTEPDALMGDTILHLRDPRYGWLHYRIPRKEAQKLVASYRSKLMPRRPVNPTRRTRSI
jgi:hypothetical protein